MADWMICPSCKNRIPLALKGPDGSIRCKSCGRIFELDKGPRLEEPHSHTPLSGGLKGAIALLLISVVALLAYSSYLRSTVSHENRLRKMRAEIVDLISTAEDDIKASEYLNAKERLATASEKIDEYLAISPDADVTHQKGRVSALLQSDTMTKGAAADRERLSKALQDAFQSLSPAEIAQILGKDLDPAAKERLSSMSTEQIASAIKGREAEFAAAILAELPDDKLPQLLGKRWETLIERYLAGMKPEELGELVATRPPETPPDEPQPTSDIAPPDYSMIPYAVDTERQEKLNFRRIFVNFPPSALTLSDDENILFLADRTGDKVAAFSTADLANLGEIPTGRNPIALEAIDDSLFVANGGENTLTVIKPSSLEVVKTIRLASQSPRALEIAQTSAGTFLYVLTTTHLHTVNIDALEEKGVPIPHQGIAGISVSGDGKLLYYWVEKGDNAGIYALDTTDNLKQLAWTPERDTPLVAGPYGDVLFGSGSVYSRYLDRLPIGVGGRGAQWFGSNRLDFMSHYDPSTRSIRFVSFKDFRILKEVPIHLGPNVKLRTFRISKDHNRIFLIDTVNRVLCFDYELDRIPPEKFLRVLFKPLVTVPVGEEVSFEPELFSKGTPRITYRVAGAPEALRMDENSGRITWKPTEEDLGTHRLVVNARDEEGNFASVELALNVGYKEVELPDAGPIATTDSGDFLYSAVPPRQSIAIYSIKRGELKELKLDATPIDACEKDGKLYIVKEHSVYLSVVNLEQMEILSPVKLPSPGAFAVATPARTPYIYVAIGGEAGYHKGKQYQGKLFKTQATKLKSFSFAGDLERVGTMAFTPSGGYLAVISGSDGEKGGLVSCYRVEPDLDIITRLEELWPQSIAGDATGRRFYANGKVWNEELKQMLLDTGGHFITCDPGRPLVLSLRKDKASPSGIAIDIYDARTLIRKSSIQAPPSNIARVGEDEMLYTRLCVLSAHAKLALQHHTGILFFPVNLDELGK